jgi:hypothetical protein
MLTYNTIDITPEKCQKYKIEKDNNEILKQNSIADFGRLWAKDPLYETRHKTD